MRQAAAAGTNNLGCSTPPPSRESAFLLPSLGLPKQIAGDKVQGGLADTQAEAGGAVRLPNICAKRGNAVAQKKEKYTTQKRRLKYDQHVDEDEDVGKNEKKKPDGKVVSIQGWAHKKRTTVGKAAQAQPSLLTERMPKKVVEEGKGCDINLALSLPPPKQQSEIGLVPEENVPLFRATSPQLLGSQDIAATLNDMAAMADVMFPQPSQYHRSSAREIAQLLGRIDTDGSATESVDSDGDERKAKDVSETQKEKGPTGAHKNVGNNKRKVKDRALDETIARVAFSTTSEEEPVTEKTRSGGAMIEAIDQMYSLHNEVSEIGGGVDVCETKHTTKDTRETGSDQEEKEEPHVIEGSDEEAIPFMRMNIQVCGKILK